MFTWIDSASHAALAEIAKAKGLTKTEVLARALEKYRREVFLEGVADDFAAIAADPVQWAEEVEERELFDGALRDRLKG